MVDVDAALERFSGFLVGAFGDRVLVSIAIEMLRDITPDMVYDCIVTNKPLLDGVSNSDWQKFRKYANKINIKMITTDDLLHHMQRHRSDLLGIVINTPGGIQWFNGFINDIKAKLLAT